MIPFNKNLHYSTKELFESGLSYKVRNLIPQNTKNVFINSWCYFPAFANELGFEDSIIKLEGFFKITHVEPDDFSEDYLSIMCTESSFVNDALTTNSNEIKIDRLSTLTNLFFDYPDLLVKLRTYEAKKDTKEYFWHLKNHITKDYLINLIELSNCKDKAKYINEINDFKLKKDAYESFHRVDWYDSIDNSKKYMLSRSFNDRRFITINNLKRALDKKYFCVLAKYLNDIGKTYFYIDSEEKKFVFNVYEEGVKNWHEIKSSFSLKGFINPLSKTTKNRNSFSDVIMLSIDQYCYINNTLPLEKMFFLNPSFNELMPYVYKKGGFTEIESKYVKLAQSIIDYSIIGATDIVCYFDFDDVISFSKLFNIDLSAYNKWINDNSTSQARNTRAVKEVKTSTSNISGPIKQQEDQALSESYNFYNQLEGLIKDSRSTPNFKIFLSVIETIKFEMKKNENTFQVGTTFPDFYSFIEKNFTEIKKIKSAGIHTLTDYENVSFKRENLQDAFERLSRKVRTQDN